MEARSKNMRLKEWLIAQVDSGKYAGLSWEKEDKSMFRIPWKHAAKQDYRQNEDAALFKAWAMYKGKYREGRDRADPTTWKTRLRCALNKSTDFQEVPERSQLDLSEPYKVYCIQKETGRATESPQAESPVVIQTSQSSAPLRNAAYLHPQAVEGSLLPQLGSHCESEEGNGAVRPNEGVVAVREHPYYCLNAGPPRGDSSAPPALSLSLPLPLPLLFSPTLQISDFRVQVRLFYQGQLVVDVTTSTPEGCFILQGHVPLGNERIYGPCTTQQVSFPPPGVLTLPPGIAEAMGRLLAHLEKGVLVWVAPDGVFIKRFCQGRVYWSGPLAQHRDRPNKLDRERTCRLLDTPIFLKELQDYLQGEGPQPRFEIDLCFGEEFPDSSQRKTRKLIMAQVVPLFAVDLLQRFQRVETEESPRLHTINTLGEKGSQPHPLPQT